MCLMYLTYTEWKDETFFLEQSLEGLQRAGFGICRSYFNKLGPRDSKEEERNVFGFKRMPLQVGLGAEQRNSSAAL